MAQKKISIRIDGELVSATEGMTILEAARGRGRRFRGSATWTGSPRWEPAVCAWWRWRAIGRLLPACTTPAQDGMSVTTTSPQLTRYRRMVIELLLVERNHICAVCVSNGHCELQSLAKSLGVSSVRYPYNYPRLPVDLSHNRFVLDHNRCVLCTRCVRVCAEVEGAHVWEVANRGIKCAGAERAEPALGNRRELHQLR